MTDHGIGRDAERAQPAPRPRPQFGELATPEEQRAAIAVPADIAASEPVPIVEPKARRGRDSGSGAGVTAPSRDSGSAPTGTTEPGTGTAAAVRAPADRFVSWLLLGLGLFNILTTSAALIDLPAAITQFFSADGLDPYGPVGIARALGIGALVVTVALWILTFVFVQRRVKAGRTSWWITIIAGVIANVIVLVCVGGAMMIDPSVFQYIQQMSGVPS